MKADSIKDTVIFLDIDYVLNDENTEEKYAGFTGIDDEKVRILKDIVDFLDADIVLTSSWRALWARDMDKSPRWSRGRYLDKKLAEHGLRIADKTPDLSWSQRGLEISAWLSQHRSVNAFVILDDEDFFWKEHGLADHWVSTFIAGPIGHEGGLAESHLDYIKSEPARFSRAKQERCEK